MIRLLIFILLLVLTSIAAAWFIENDGSVIVEWMGYRIQTSVGFAIIMGVVLVAMLTLMVESFLWVRSLPERYRRKRKENMRENGIAALTEGFAAIASNDAKSARKLTGKAESCLGKLPVTQLLSAQTSKLEGNVEQAKQEYSNMLEHKETEIIAIKGLLLQAREEGDIKKAIFLAEKAAAQAKSAEWPIVILLDLYKHEKQWSKLEATIDVAMSKKVLSRQEAMHLLAVCSLAKATEAVNEGEIDRALGLALSAMKLEDGFIPALLQAGRLHIRQEQPKHALKLVEKNWSKHAHPQLLELYIEAIGGENHQKTLQQAEKLNGKYEPVAEHLMVLGRYAMRTHQLEKAKEHLQASLNLRETQEAALLYAELLRRQNADNDAINRAESQAVGAEAGAAWHCASCAHHTAEWQPCCPQCQVVDTLEWKQKNIQASGTVLPSMLIGQTDS